jgi:homoserine O-succinyltransferase/O-acetyltransferase
VPKYALPAKQFGVFKHHILEHNVKLLHGVDDVFYAPPSYHTEIRRADIERVPELKVLAESDEAGVYIAASRGGRQIFVTGHSEYDPLTLKNEYDRTDAAVLRRGSALAVSRQVEARAALLLHYDCGRILNRST